jgi:hypothetical protein
MEPLAALCCNCRLLALPKIRQMELENTLAYYDAVIITAVKSFVVTKITSVKVLLNWAQCYKTFSVRNLRIFVIS